MPINTAYAPPKDARVKHAYRSPPFELLGNSHSRSAATIVPSWQTKISQHLFPGYLYAKYGATSSIVPIIAPAGITNRSEFRVLNPKSLMKIGMNDDTCMRGQRHRNRINTEDTKQIRRKSMLQNSRLRTACAKFGFHLPGHWQS